MSTLKTKHFFLTLLLCFIMFCTIQDDNGNPVVSGPETPLVVPIVTPTTAPLLLASSDSIYIKKGDTLAVIARVFSDTTGSRDSLRPLSGARVTAHASRGRIIDDTIISDINGRARFLITDTTIGRIEMTLSSNGTDQVFRFEVTNTPDRIQKLIQVLPTTAVIKADNRDTTSILVTVINELHNPISNENIQFISTTGVITGDGSNKENSGLSKTDKNGIARAVLRSTNINDTAYITAYVVSDQSLSDETEVVFKGMSITVTNNRSNMAIGDTALITARLLNASGIPVSKTPIFITRGNGTGSNLSVIFADSVTNHEGFAFFKVRAVRNGMDNVTFNAAGTQSSIQLNVSSLRLLLSINKSVLQTNATDSALLTATFTNNAGTPLSGRTITLTRTYKTESGSDTSDVIRQLSDISGRTSMTIKALNYEGSMRVEAIGFDPTEGYASADTTFQFLTTRVMIIRGPESIPADGETKKPITVIIKNKSGNPIVGDVVTFSSTAGVITTKSTTNEDGKAIAYLTSDRRNTKALVTATLLSDPSKTQSMNVAFTGVKIEITTNPPSISSDNRDTSHISISLIDAAGKVISGEPVNFFQQQLSTHVLQLDSVTNNSGEAHCLVFGTGNGRDTITVSAAGASVQTIIHYSSNRIRIDTAAGQSCIADSSDSTRFIVTYVLGDNTTRIPNATLEISATAGRLGQIFARNYTTDANGQVSFYLKNPHFAVTATISVIAHTASEMTSQKFDIYFKATTVKQIILTGTPEVIEIGTGRAKLTAIVFDSMGNRVNNARITFNIANGPSGGEYLDPPTTITGDDGSATTYLVAGNTPSTFQQVWVNASNYSTVKSNTIKLTIVGPPRYITIRSNILKGKNPNDGTFLLPCAAIVTDINGNPVVDGTDVTFSLQVSGYVSSRLIVEWFHQTDLGVACYPVIDTAYGMLYFEDFNSNYQLDPGEEDRNSDGIANRGENVNGDRKSNGDEKWILGPPFEDINRDGKRQFDFNRPAEDVLQCSKDTTSELDYADYNKNGVWDPVEPLQNSEYLLAYRSLRAKGAFKKIGQIILSDAADLQNFAILNYWDSLYTTGEGFDPVTRSYDVDCNQNGKIDPKTAVSIVRTVQTVGGKALNQILYGQSDALKIEVRITAESQGVTTDSPEFIILPVITDDE